MPRGYGCTGELGLQVAAEFGGELRHAAAIEDPEQRLGSQGGLLGGFRLLTHRVDDHAGSEVEVVEQELVGAERLQAVAPQDCCREVANVGRHDHVGSPGDGGREDVAIIAVRQLEAVLQRLPTIEAGVWEGGVHLSEATVDALRIDLGMDGRHGALGFLENPGGLQRSVQLVLGQAQQRVSERDRDQDAGVQERSEPAHPAAGRRRASRSASA